MMAARVPLTSSVFRFRWFGSPLGHILSEQAPFIEEEVLFLAADRIKQPLIK